MSIVKCDKTAFKKVQEILGQFVRLSRQGPRGVSKIETGGDELIGAFSGLGVYVIAVRDRAGQSQR